MKDHSIKCGDHSFLINIDDHFFDDGPLIFPCPTCKDRYLVHKNGKIKLVKQGPLVRSFLAMHY